MRMVKLTLSRRNLKWRTELDSKQFAVEGAIFQLDLTSLLKKSNSRDVLLDCLMTAPTAALLASVVRVRDAPGLGSSRW